jgi:hypothetical protein
MKIQDIRMETGDSISGLHGSGSLADIEDWD